MAFWRRLFPFNSSGPRITADEQLSEPSTRGALARPVNFDQAMSISTWWACARLLTETVSSMPLRCFDVEEDGSRMPNTRNRLWRTLKYQPNRYQTRNEFFQVLMLNLCSNGNAYNEIQRDGAGRPIQFLPMMSAQTRTYLIDGNIRHRFIYPDGREKWFAPENVWHVKLFGNGIVGLSPLQYAAQSLGYNISTRDRATKIAASGGKQNGILYYDKALNKKERDKIRENLEELNKGSEDELFVLDKFMKYDRVSLSPADMKLMELMNAGIEDICRFMGVPSVLVNHTQGTSTWGSGIREIVEGFYKFDVKPYLESIESSMVRWLLPMKDWERVELEFDFDSLLRADLKTRFETWNKGVNGGILKPNEARAREGLPPAKGGDKLYLNGTLTPAGVMPMRPADNDESDAEVTP